MSKNIWGKNDIVLIKNNDIECHNCRYKCDTVATCVAYENLKPLSVLKGGKCPKKVTK